MRTHGNATSTEARFSRLKAQTDELGKGMGKRPWSAHDSGRTDFRGFCCDEETKVSFVVRFLDVQPRCFERFREARVIKPVLHRMVEEHANHRVHDELFVDFVRVETPAWL